MAFTFAWSIIIVFYVGLNKNEKQMIVNKLRSSLRKNSIFSKENLQKNKKAKQISCGVSYLSER